MLSLLRAVLALRYGRTECSRGKLGMLSPGQERRKKAIGLSFPDSEEVLGFPQWALHRADFPPVTAAHRIPVHQRKLAEKP